MMPNDPVMLLSYVNLKLRDFYPSLDDLCDDEDVDKQTVLDKLSTIGYVYNKDRNQFV
ncbi:MAG: DUF4250 domain-containing protein [Lachnospiraceae bacterium]|nr:DUF4250 domain-containing protein [Lachnospiraceae bacterium]